MKKQKNMHTYTQTHKNTRLNVLKKMIHLRKSDVSVESISVRYVTDNLAEHGNTVCHSPKPMMSYVCYHNNYDVILMSK